MHDHLEGSNMLRLEDHILAVRANFRPAYVRGVVVTCKRNLTMEKELQWSPRPWEICILTSVKVAPDPISRLLGNVLLEKRYCV